MPAEGREHLVDLVNRKGLGIKFADPVEHFFVALMVGIVEGFHQVIESGNAPTIFRWAGELPIRADWIGCVRIYCQPLLQDDAVLPAVAKIVRVNDLGANSP